MHQQSALSQGAGGYRRGRDPPASPATTAPIDPPGSALAGRSRAYCATRTGSDLPGPDAAELARSALIGLPRLRVNEAARLGGIDSRLLERRSFRRSVKSIQTKL